MPVKAKANKAKVKETIHHEEAIEDFKDWTKRHPFATHGETFRAFDRFVDSAAVRENACT